MFDALIQDVRHAARSARTNLGLTTIAVLTLGLGTGANIAIFQLVDVVRLRMLPVESPEALVELRVDDMTHARGTWLRTPSLTYRLWEEVREHSEPFSGVFAWADETLDIASAGPARRVNGLWVSGEFFQVLGVKPLVGRLFTLADDHRDCGLAPGAVISHRFWQREFGGDPSVIGKPVVFGKHRLDVIGVTPQEFFGVEVGRQFDVAMPLCASSTWFEMKGRIDSGNLWWLTVMARLKPAFTAEQAATYLEIESPKIFRATLPPGYPAASVKPYLGMKLMPTAAQHGTSRLWERYSTPLLVLLALTGLMLLVACGNLAHLMLARLASRRRELSVRVALGASRARLIQHLGVENGLLATAGVTTGLLLSLFISRFLVDLLSTDRVPIGLDLSLDHRTLAFAAFLNVVTCAAFATVPVLRAARSRATVDERLRQRNGVAIKARTRRVLLVSQIAVSLILLSGAFLFARTLRNLHTLDPGFERDGTVIVDVTFSDSQQPSERNAQLRREFLEQVLSLQPVKSVAEVLIVPLTAGNWNNRVWLDGSDPDQPQVVYRNMVAPGYFRTLNTSVVAGREFTDADTDTSSPRSAIVNEAFIASLGLGDNVVSRAFWVEATAFEPRTRYEIVGVVKNTKYRDLREPFRPTVFVPLSRAALARANGQFVMRSSASPQALSASLAAAVSRTKTAIRYSMQTIDSLEEESLGRERLMVATSVPIALFAVVLAGIGLYGVTSYAIAQRRNEIGVRIALGATQEQVRGLILQEAVAVALVGIVAGTLLTMAIGRSIGTLFYEVPPHDPLSLSATALLLAGVAGLAAYLPARRAARMDPVASLRGDW